MNVKILKQLEPLIYLAVMILTLLCCSCGASRSAYLVHVGGVAADATTTKVFLKQGIHEANPIIGERGERLIPIKVGEGALLLWADSKLRHHPGWQKALRIGSGVINFGAAGWNTWLITHQPKEKKR